MELLKLLLLLLSSFIYLFIYLLIYIIVVVAAAVLPSLSPFIFLVWLFVQLVFVQAIYFYSFLGNKTYVPGDCNIFEYLFVIYNVIEEKIAFITKDLELQTIRHRSNSVFYWQTSFSDLPSTSFSVT